MKEQPKSIFNDDHVLETVFRQILSYLYRTKIGIASWIEQYWPLAKYVENFTVLKLSVDMPDLSLFIFITTTSSKGTWFQ